MKTFAVLGVCFVLSGCVKTFVEPTSPATTHVHVHVVGDNCGCCPYEFVPAPETPGSPPVSTKPKTPAPSPPPIPETPRTPEEPETPRPPADPPANDRDEPKCNAGGGNGSEGCNPGNSGKKGDKDEGGKKGGKS